MTSRSTEVGQPAPPSASPAVRAAVALGITAAATAAAIFVLGDAAYPWVKAVHVIAIISWMAGMLYLPRLFIYHCDAPSGSQQSETFKVMERRLLEIIINPAMIVSWVLGLWLGWKGGFFSEGWFHVKLVAALALSGVHGYFSASVRAFREDRNARPPRHWRILNEVPTLLMIAIVVLVIVKPF
ncbi:MAG: protoporphyrinogen oxidase HemJ [Hyphomicrobiaceae bacterium]